MMEYLTDSEEELKRVDHLIYVSLKYTRTVDVFKNIFERLIAATDFIMDGLLEKLAETKKISEIPTAYTLKCNCIKKALDNEKINRYVDVYILIRALSKADYTKKNEFRRHVTMIAELKSGAIEEVTIETIHEFYSSTKEFLEYVKELNESKAL